MTSLTLAIALSLTHTSLAQASTAIRELEITTQNEAYQRWWDQELVWRFDDFAVRRRRA